MKKVLSIGFVLAFCMVSAIPAWAPVVNLVDNGDFETPVVGASQEWDIYDSGTADLGWTVEWYGGSTSYGGQTRPEPAHLELHRGVNNWNPYTGDQHAELDTDWDGPGGGLNGEPASVKIYQDIPTCPGAYYDLTYAWSPRPSHTDNGLVVRWDGTQIDAHSGSGGSNTSWTQEDHLDLVASSDFTRLEFIETGYVDSSGMFLDSVSVTEVSLCVLIDIKPGSYPNCFNNDGHGVIPVAILGDCSGFVSEIDPSTVQLGALMVRARGRNSEKYLAHIEDVNGDSCDDLVVQIEDSDGAFAPGTGTATLEGFLNDGTHFVGSDEICVVPY